MLQKLPECLLCYGINNGWVVAQLTKQVVGVKVVNFSSDLT